MRRIKNNKINIDSYKLNYIGLANRNSSQNG